MKRAVAFLGLTLALLGTVWASRSMSIPADNPITPEKAELGRRLFYDPLLSSDQSIACASCHKPEFAFSDAGQRVSTGVYGQKGFRNSPTLINVGYRTALFAEGRSPRLELQAIGPLTAADEMGIQPEELTRRLEANPSYARAFRAVFGEAPSMKLAAYALSAFERTLIAQGSPYDRYLAGDAQALSALAREGLELFNGKAGCSRCHTGPDLTDDRPHNVGVQSGDVGLARATGNPDDTGKFKTPTLRNIALTAPYMHDGSMGSLLEVIGFFNQGPQAANLDPQIHPLELSLPEARALEAFLQSLTDPIISQASHR